MATAAAVMEAEVEVEAVTDIHPDAKRVLTFWFEEHDGKDWFGGKPEFDDEVRRQFSDTLRAAAACELWAWRSTARGRLAEIIVLDQFSRQLHRGSPLAFASDPLALALAQEAVAQGLDTAMTDAERQFLYLPFMHSESLAVHEEAMRLFSSLDADTFAFEEKHRDILLQFGRYPLRNAALGRASTPAEEQYIAARDGNMF